MANPDPDFISFLRAYPAYPSTHIIDDLRASEYARLDLGGHIYLDYTGGGLYAESQLRRHHKMLSEHVFGNPHSSNPTSQEATPGMQYLSNQGSLLARLHEQTVGQSRNSRGLRKSAPQRHMGRGAAPA